MIERTVFVPNGESQRETAILLVGTAREYGVSQREIAPVNGGFWITQQLADLVYDETEPEPEPAAVKEQASTTKTSGNRAAKKNSKEE